MARLALSAQGPTVSRCDRSGPVEICAGAEGPLFRVHVLGARICVEHRTAFAARRELACYAVFDDEAQFLEWCDWDEARLSNPLTQRRLRQAGRDLLAEHREFARETPAADQA